jgi:c-di-GMP-binding flagellar brake protein YcgR
MNDSERRNGPRVELRETARFKVFGNEETGRMMELRAAEMVNVSMRGVCAYFDRMLEKGTILRMNFLQQSTNLKDSIKAFCEVMWSEDRRNGQYMAGLSILTIRDDDEKRLEDYIARRQKTQRVV